MLKVLLFYSITILSKTVPTVSAQADEGDSSKSGTHHPSHYALCLGNFNTCHDYVETLVISDPIRSKHLVNEESEKIQQRLQESEANNINSDNYDLKLEESEDAIVNSNDTFYSVTLQSLPGKLHSLRRVLANQMISVSRILNPYLNFCATPQDLYENAHDVQTYLKDLSYSQLQSSSSQSKILQQLPSRQMASESQILRLLKEPTLCNWGKKHEHTVFSLDGHARILSNFADGYEQMVNGGLQEDIIRPWSDLIIDLCQQMQAVSLVMYHGSKFNGVVSVPIQEMIIEVNVTSKTQSNSNESPNSQYNWPESFDNPLIQTAGEELSKLLLKHRDRAKAVLKIASALVDQDNELHPGLSVCIQGKEATKQNSLSSRSQMLLFFSLLLTQNARFLMENARTAIAIKMLFLEVSQMHQNQHGFVDMNLAPKYIFRPIAFGRHWDLLDTLLLGLDREGEWLDRDRSEWDREKGEIDPLKDQQLSFQNTDSQSSTNLLRLSGLPTMLDRDVRFLLKSASLQNSYENQLAKPLQKLFDLRTRKNLKVLEIGVAVGQNGLYLLHRYPRLHYTGIDPTIAEPVVERFEKRFKTSRFTLLPHKSEDVIDQFPDHHFDLIFIDGPHTYKHVNSDILLYSQKVKPGTGLLVGHDFSCVHPPLLWGVSDKRLYGQEINYGMDGVWWWRMPELEEGKEEL